MILDIRYKDGRPPNQIQKVKTTRIYLGFPEQLAVECYGESAIGSATLYFRIDIIEDIKITND